MSAAIGSSNRVERANVVSVHRTVIACEAHQAGDLLDRFDEPASPCWPHEAWPRDRFEAPLQIGALGGHGATRYRVIEYRPGRELVFRFEAPRGFEGVHGLCVETDGALTRVTHFTRLRLSPYHFCMWHGMVRWVHDALIGDLLDGMERHLTGTVARPRRWRWRVRMFRHALGGSRLITDYIKSIWRKA